MFACVLSMDGSPYLSETLQRGRRPDSRLVMAAVILCCVHTAEADDESSLMRSRGQPKRAPIGQRRRRRRDVTGRQDGDDSRLPVVTMKSITDVSDTNGSHEQSSVTLNPRTPLPAIHTHSAISTSTFCYYILS